MHLKDYHRASFQKDTNGYFFWLPLQMLPPSDDHFMRLALAEGRRALPACLPNPPVGCVLVRGGEVIATGHTQPPGNPHAEALALARVEGDLHGVTAYVTLEPCSFQGRTPSCARTLVARGVQRVVVALLDPDERNNGAGIRILEEGGVEVSVGLLGDEARRDLAPHLALPENNPAHRHGHGHDH